MGEKEFNEVWCSVLYCLHYPLILLKKSLRGHKEKQKAFFLLQARRGGGEGGGAKSQDFEISLKCST
jgi:hypothetical protein